LGAVKELGLESAPGPKAAPTHEGTRVMMPSGVFQIIKM